MKKVIITSCLVACLSIWLAAQGVQYGIVSQGQGSGMVCVEAVMTDPAFPAHCLNGGDVVLVAPTSFELRQEQVKSALGQWTIVTDGFVVDGKKLYQLTSTSVSTDLHLSQDGRVMLFCIDMDSRAPERSQVRLLDQEDHFTPGAGAFEKQLFEAGVQHTAAASFSSDCVPSDGTVFSGIVKGNSSIDVSTRPLPSIGKEITFSVYPNPATEGVRIEMLTDGSVIPAMITFYNTAGQMVHHVEVPEGATMEYIDFKKAGIESGAYSIRISDASDETLATETIVVQR